MKWAIIAAISLFLILAIAEGVRRGGGGSTEPGFGETGSGAAVAEHLRGNQWEKEESPPTNTVREEEFDRAEAITDSREQSFEDAKGKTRVFIDAIRK